MNIDFTPTQFRILLTLTWLGGNVVNSFRSAEENTNSEELNGSDKLIQYIFSRCGDFNAEDCVEFYDSRFTGTQEYFFGPSASFKDIISEKYLFRFSDGVFWSQLIKRLAERDINTLYDLSKMKPEEASHVIQGIISKYYNEFLVYGLDNIRVVGFDNPQNVIEMGDIHTKEGRKAVIEDVFRQIFTTGYYIKLKLIDGRDVEIFRNDNKDCVIVHGGDGILPEKVMDKKYFTEEIGPLICRFCIKSILHELRDDDFDVSIVKDFVGLTDCE